MAFAQTRLFPYQGGTGATSTPSLGSLLVGVTSAQYGVLPVGGNGLFLVASSSQPFGVTWASASAGAATPGGSTTQVQYNNGGALDGATNFVFVTNQVGIGTPAPSSTLHVVGTFRTSGTNTFDGAINASSTFTNSAATILGSTLSVGGNTSLQNTSTTNTYVAGTFTVSGFSTGILHSNSSGVISSSLVGVADLASVDFGDWTCNGSACTIDANAVALATDTTGNYVATIADDGQSTITVNNSGAENAGVTLRVVDVSCTDCLGATEIADSYLLNNGDDGNGDYNFYGVASSTELRSPSSTLGTIKATGAILASSTLDVTSATILGSTLQVGGNTSLQNTSTTNAYIAGTFQVTGGSTLAALTTTGTATLNSLVISDITGSTQCLHADSSGAVTGTGSDCGAGGAGSVSTSTPITAFTFPFWQTTAGALNGSSSIYYSAGNIGINTPAPSSSLHVVGTFRTSGTNTFDGAINASSTFTNSAATILGSTLSVGGSSSLQNTSTTNAYVAGTFQVTGGSTVQGLLANASSSFLTTLSVATTTYASNAVLTIATSSPIFTVLNNGKVGIGTSTPALSFVVADIASSSAAMSVDGSGGNSTTTITIGTTGKPMCLKARDSDDGGWSYGTVLNGAISWSSGSCE